MRGISSAPRPIRAKLLGAATLIGFALFSTNPLESLFGIVSFLACWTLLAKHPIGPAMCFAILFQWLQVTVPLMSANLAGVALSEVPGLAALRPAVYLGYISLLFLSLGANIGMGAVRSRADALKRFARDQFKSIGIGKLVKLYFLALALTLPINWAISKVPSLAQQLQTVASARWILVYFIFAHWRWEPRARSAAITVIALEVVMGFFSYFSSFKFVFYLALVANAYSGGNQNANATGRKLALAVVVLLLSCFWQAKKAEYRIFLSGGERSQQVLVGPVESLSFILRSLTEVDVASLKSGFETGITRTGYLEYFACTIENVPANVPYQLGRLWGEALTHVIMPRALFPSKGIINDSDRTNEFSGTKVAGAEEGTSISIGYAGESYIDFGPFLMMVPIFFMGLMWGKMFSVLSASGKHAAFGQAMATVLALRVAMSFGDSNIKILGATINAFLIYWLAMAFASRLKLQPAGSR